VNFRLAVQYFGRALEGLQQLERVHKATRTLKAKIEGTAITQQSSFSSMQKSRQIAQGRLKDANPFDYSEMLYNEAK
jgi:hypothetical protein